jgi:glycosyltransferase involved in cell wall biosynthesis
LGRVLIEAGMMSKPVITFGHAGGHHDIIENGVNGLMTNSIEEYSAAIAHLTHDTALAKAFGENARKLYERNFSPQAVIPGLLEYYSH